MPFKQTLLEEENVIVYLKQGLFNRTYDAFIISNKTASTTNGKIDQIFLFNIIHICRCQKYRYKFYHLIVCGINKDSEYYLEK